MSELWKKWEGQIADNKYPLQQFLGGTGHSAVFLTQIPDPEPRQAAIKLISAEVPAADRQLAVWSHTAQLSHPNLLRLFHAGRCRIADTSLLYVLMEYAEENLGQILPQRALTPDETRDLLNPVVDALVYLHAKSLAHTHLKPSNLFAVGDQIKLSTDTVYPIGQLRGTQRERDAYDSPESVAFPYEASRTCADTWSLGVTLVEALTQTAPALPSGSTAEPVVPGTLPQPFLDVARHALLREPTHRWLISEIAARLSRGTQAAASAAAASASSSASPLSPLSVQLSSEPAIPLAKLPAAQTSGMSKPKHRAAPPRPGIGEESTLSARAGRLPNFVIPALLGAFVLVVGVLAVPRLFRYHPDPTPAALSASADSRPAQSATTPAQKDKPAFVEPARPDSGKSNSAKPSAAPKKLTEDLSAAGPAKTGSHDAVASPALLRSEPASAAKSASANPARGEVLDQVLPNASEKSLSTIQGTLRVSVRVQVSAAGIVSGTELDQPVPSMYFANLAQQAARRWQFTSPESDGRSLPSEWLIRFEFTPSGVHAFPSQTKP